MARVTPVHQAIALRVKQADAARAVAALSAAGIRASYEPHRTGGHYLVRIPRGVSRRRAVSILERANPHIGFKELKAQLAQRPDVRSPGALAAWIGRRKYGAAAMRRAAKARRSLRGQGGQRNPDATALTEAFHGRPAEKVTEYTETMRERAELADLGRLVSLTVGQGGSDYELAPSRAGIRVTSTPEGGQLYFIGGDQSVALEELGISAEDTDGKDQVELGKLRRIVYHTSKAFHRFEPLDYEHKFGEGTGRLPTLAYDRLNRSLFVIGGAYQVRPEGIVG